MSGALPICAILNDRSMWVLVAEDQRKHRHLLVSQCDTANVTTLYAMLTPEDMARAAAGTLEAVDVFSTRELFVVKRPVGLRTCEHGRFSLFARGAMVAPGGAA